MSKVIEKLKSWREPKHTIHEETTETRAETSEFVPREEGPMFVPDITIEQVIYNSMNRIQENIDTGIWDLERNWKHMLSYYSAAKRHVVLMESIVPDDQFRREIIAAEREPDYVEQGMEIMKACHRLMIRRKVGLKQRPQMDDFEPDETETYGRYYEDDDEEPEDS
jgi:hypothetical protein